MVYDSLKQVQISCQDINGFTTGLVQVDLGIPSIVSGLVMQGRYNIDQWVTQYKIQYSLDEITWFYLTDGTGEGEEDAVRR